MVWEWERFQDGIPVGYDAVHYGPHPCIRGLTWRQISDTLGKGVMRSGL